MHACVIWHVLGYWCESSLSSSISVPGLDNWSIQSGKLSTGSSMNNPCKVGKQEFHLFSRSHRYLFQWLSEFDQVWWSRSYFSAFSSPKSSPGELLMKENPEGSSAYTLLLGMWMQHSLLGQDTGHRACPLHLESAPIPAVNVLDQLCFCFCFLPATKGGMCKAGVSFLLGLFCSISELWRAGPDLAFGILSWTSYLLIKCSEITPAWLEEQKEEEGQVVTFADPNVEVLCIGALWAGTGEGKQRSFQTSGRHPMSAGCRCSWELWKLVGTLFPVCWWCRVLQACHYSHREQHVPPLTWDERRDVHCWCVFPPGFLLIWLNIQSGLYILPLPWLLFEVTVLNELVWKVIWFQRGNGFKEEKE